jgi:hypothetical protein
MRQLKMSVSTVTTLCVLVLVSVVVGGAQEKATQISRPFFGHWTLNPAKSDLTTTSLIFEGSPSGDITMTAMGASQTFRLDGKERPGMLGSTALWTQTGPQSWRTLYRSANVDNNIDNYTLSDDGQQLTLTTDILVPTKSREMWTFHRIAGGPGLMGTWQTQRIQANESIEFSAAEGGRVKIHWVPWGATVIVTTDGKDTPVEGPASYVTPGTTVGLAVTGPRTFDLSMKLKGVSTAFAKVTVAADGKSMAMNTTRGPDGPTQQHLTATYEKK